MSTLWNTSATRRTRLPKIDEQTLAEAERRLRDEMPKLRREIAERQRPYMGNCHQERGL